MSTKEQLIIKIRMNQTVARTAYFRKTRRGTKGMNPAQLATAMIAAGMGFYSF